VKFIQKAGCPHAYSSWCAGVAGTEKSDWREVPPATKAELLRALVHEQGALCAYTMRRIDNSSAHVEHIKPQSRCRADARGSDLDYDNLVACFPRAGMKAAYRYGAQKKENWWANDGAEFLSPLQNTCERFFRFDLDGEISAVGDRAAGVMTIGVLGLDHPSLVEDRKRVIEEFIYGPRGDEPLSQANALRARGAICIRDGRGYFYEFCVAIRGAVDDYLDSLARLARRRKAARRRR
jgi:uncharacterized protein (TIGR02646 family)